MQTDWPRTRSRTRKKCPRQSGSGRKSREEIVKEMKKLRNKPARRVMKRRVTIWTPVLSEFINRKEVLSTGQKRFRCAGKGAFGAHPGNGPPGTAAWVLPRPFPPRDTSGCRGRVGGRPMGACQFLRTVCPSAWASSGDISRPVTEWVIPLAVRGPRNPFLDGWSISSFPFRTHLNELLLSVE